MKENEKIPFSTLLRMMMEQDGIEEKMLKLLINTSPKTYFAISATNRGYELLIRTPNDDSQDPSQYAEFKLCLTHGVGPRLWKSLDKLLLYIRKLSPKCKSIEILL